MALIPLVCRNVFSAGTSHYGVADCGLLAADTHKFESRYLDLLIGVPQPELLDSCTGSLLTWSVCAGPYPEAKKTYDERSAINYMDKFSAPCMFFQAWRSIARKSTSAALAAQLTYLLQGDEDKVVPPKQAELMYEGLKERGITTGLVMFKGEQHGFRGANAIRRALEVLLRVQACRLGQASWADCVHMRRESCTSTGRCWASTQPCPQTWKHSRSSTCTGSEPAGQGRACMRVCVRGERLKSDRPPG